MSLGLRRVVGSLALILALVGLLWLLSAYASSFWQGLFVNLGMFLILVLSLNLFNGFTGVFSLGHIGFMALGAYIAAILTLSPDGKRAYLPDLPGWLAPVHLDQMVGPFPLGFLVATLIAGLLVALLAFLVGLVLMRLSGHYVAVATLGFLIIVRVTLINADVFTRGSRTFSNIAAFTDLWWVYAWVTATVYVAWRVKFSAYGRSMFAQREDRWAAQSIGITMMRPRLLAFVISAFFTAVAGSLYAHFITSMSPTVFYVDLTFRVITMLVLGGLGSVSGSILGTVFIVFLGEGLRRVEDVTLLYGMSNIIIAVILLLLIIFRRQGLLGQNELNLGWLFGNPPSSRKKEKPNL